MPGAVLAQWAADMALATFNLPGRRHGLARSIVLWTATVLLVGTDLARAQDAQEPQPTRNEMLAAAREAKAADVTPPRRNVVERALAWYDERDGILQWKGLHFAAGGFNTGAGLGYGFGVKREAIGAALADPRQPNRVDVSALAARSVRGYRRLAARIDLFNVAGGPVDLAARVQDFDNTQEVFYGTGADSGVDNRTNYRVDGAEAGLDMRWRISPVLSAFSSVSMWRGTMADGTDSRYPSALDVFDESSAPGITGVPDYLRGDVSLAVDTRDSESHPRRGRRYAAGVSFFDGRGGSAFDFQRLTVETQHLFPLGSRYRRLEWRAAAAFTTAGDGAEVPIVFQPTLGGVRSLRGFRETRFRDRHAVSATAEYQWEAWWALDAAVFVDAGQVFDRLAAFTMDRFEYAYGVGFRLHGNERFLARLDLAFSREGFVPLLGFKYGF